MVLRMSLPWRHPKSGIWYFRERVPASLRASLRGITITLTVAGEPRGVRVGEAIKVSLATKDRQTARDRHRDVASQVSKLYASRREGEGLSLTHEQVLQLAGEWYRQIVADYRANPGDPVGWEEGATPIQEALENLRPHSPEDHEKDEAHGREPNNPELGERRLRALLRADEYLAARGLRLAPASLTTFLQHAGVAHLRAYWELTQMAGGDYRPHPEAVLYPAEPFKPQQQAPSVDLWTIFDAWEAERKPRPGTVRDYRFNVQQFVDRIGHQDAARITKRDVLDWKDALVVAGVPAKTINDSKLAALKSVLNYALKNDRIAANPAHGVSVPENGDVDMGGFSDDEALAILSACAASDSATIRWVPLLCAMTGARVAEMVQLRKQDVMVENGIWVVNITPEAGLLKNKPSRRKVPIHPTLIQRGFLAFVAGRKDGPMFFAADRRREGVKAKPGKGAINHLREFVHDVAVQHGLKIGRKQRKDPNHAWRHRFVSLARLHHMDREKREYMLGHKLEADLYGGMAGLLPELCKLPDPFTGKPVDPDMSRVKEDAARNDSQGATQTH